ncbi:MAG: DUF971 domain-containing protein [Planctomycetota bacterium]
MTYDASRRPTGLEATETGIRITWADGAVTEIGGEDLRRACPCANCVDEWTGERRFRDENAVGVGVRAMNQVGNYAFAIVFTDGHETGIFSYPRLRELGDPQA